MPGGGRAELEHQVMNFSPAPIRMHESQILGELPHFAVTNKISGQLPCGQ